MLLINVVYLEVSSQQKAHRKGLLQEMLLMWNVQEMASEKVSWEFECDQWAKQCGVKLSGGGVHEVKVITCGRRVNKGKQEVSLQSPSRQGWCEMSVLTEHLWVGVRCLSSQKICVCVCCRRLCVYFVHHQRAATLSNTVKKKITHLSTNQITGKPELLFWLAGFSDSITADNFVCSGPFLFKTYECDCHFRGAYQWGGCSF